MSASEQSSTTAQRIYRDLRQSIILGRYRPGDRLNSDALVEHYGVSNTPVREALQMLSREGLVTIKPHSGYFVTQITLKQLQLHDLLELRQILEVASVERAASRINTAQVEELEQVHAGYTGDDDESRVRYILENRRFHYLVALASGNQQLAETLGHLHDRLTPFWVLVHSGDEMEQIHQRLIDALRSKDIAGARQAILDEVNETRDATLKHVIRQGGDLWLIGAQRNDHQE